MKIALIWGANPMVSHARMSGSLRKAVRNGTKLVVIDPSRTQTAQLQRCHRNERLSRHPAKSDEERKKLDGTLSVINASKDDVATYISPGCRGRQERIRISEGKGSYGGSHVHS